MNACADRTYPRHPSIGVAAAVWRDGRLLLVGRARAPWQGYWCLPGGLLELGETLAAAVERQVREETGLQVRAGRVLDALDLLERDQEGRLRHHYVPLVLRSQYRDGEARPGSDAAALGWFAADELPACLCPDVPQIAARGPGS